MQVHYYEATALCHPGNLPGQPVTLEDYHRTAWRLFAGEAHHAAAERPFVFRTEWLSAERHVFIIRSAQPFAHAQTRTMDIRQGSTMTLEWHWVPSVSTRLSANGARLPRSRHVPAPRERWETLAAERLHRQGFSVMPDTLTFCPLGQWQHRYHRPYRQHVVLVSAEVEVIDERLAANAWLQGVSRLRAYGMGMLCAV